jgi:preprotein translocase SecF subunit
MALAFVRLIPKETSIRFVRLRKVAFAVSSAAILGSIIAVMTLGFNLGIDFKGGGNIEVITEEPADLDKIGTIVRGLDLGEIELRTFGSPNDVLIRFERQEATDPDQNVEKLQQDAARKVHVALYELYSGLKFEFDGKQNANVSAPSALDLEKGQKKIAELKIEGLVLAVGADEKSLTLTLPTVVVDRKSSPELQQQLFAQVKYALLETYSTLQSEGTEIVGPKVSGELVQSGITAVFGALFCMLLYIWFRFEWQFSVGAVLALTHDVILTAGMFAITRIEFNLASIAAILTIVGYSMNDTVVVYDRIREKMRKYSKMDLPDLIDLAINKTLSRTSITSLTTLLALVSLYFLGGETLRGFAATMIWGVVVGTYSSIFIAAPLLLALGVKRGALED